MPGLPKRGRLAYPVRSFLETQETGGEEKDCSEECKNRFQAYPDEP